MKKTIVVMAWVTLLVAGIVISTFNFIDSRDEKQNKARDEHVKAMGSACIHHVHNMASPADANKKGFYGTMGYNEALNLEMSETLSCLQMYPLYSEQAPYSSFNTMTN